MLLCCCGTFVRQVGDAVVDPGRGALDLLQLFLRGVVREGQHQSDQEPRVVQDLRRALVQVQRPCTSREGRERRDQRRVERDPEGDLRDVPEVELGPTLQVW